MAAEDAFAVAAVAVAAAVVAAVAAAVVVAVAGDFAAVAGLVAGTSWGQPVDLQAVAAEAAGVIDTAE